MASCVGLLNQRPRWCKRLMWLGTLVLTVLEKVREFAGDKIGVVVI